MFIQIMITSARLEIFVLESTGKKVYCRSWEESINAGRSGNYPLPFLSFPFFLFLPFLFLHSFPSFLSSFLFAFFPSIPFLPSRLLAFLTYFLPSSYNSNSHHLYIFNCEYISSCQSACYQLLDKKCWCCKTVSSRIAAVEHDMLEDRF